MKIVIGLIALAIAAFQLPPAFAGPASLNQEQMLIMRKALAPGGKLDKESHDRFWAGMPKPTDEDLEKFRAQTDRLTTSGIRFQVEAMKSAKLSYERQTPTFSDDFDSVKQEFLRASEPHGAAASVQRALTWADQLIDHAARRAPIEQSGQQIVPTPQILGPKIVLMTGSLRRAKLLFDPEWHGQ